jgi:hypothetical protein
MNDRLPQPPENLRDVASTQLAPIGDTFEGHLLADAVVDGCVAAATEEAA